MMRFSCFLTVFLCVATCIFADGEGGRILHCEDYGERLPCSSGDVAVWRASSGWKVGHDRAAPSKKADALEISLARNEAEAAQIVVRPGKSITGFTASGPALTGPEGAVLPASAIDVLRVRYVYVDRPTDTWSVKGWWPDPLPPFKGPITLEPGKNQPLWVRVTVPEDQKAGVYTGTIQLRAEDWQADVPVRVKVWDFTLPDRMTCTTAFGFTPSLVFQYQKISDPDQRRAVYEKYLENLSDHHISPYSPAALDPYSYEFVKLSAEEAATYPEEERQARMEHAITASFDWSDWNPEMKRLLETYHFNSFRLSAPGLGGGTFYGHGKPKLQGFTDDEPEYYYALNDWLEKLESNLRQLGMLDEGFMYWFDEPAPRDYPHVLRGFQKIKAAAPDLRRMITERVADGLIGGPDIWCPTPIKYKHERAEKRRAEGEEFWWYLCTVPKKPYPGLFIDRAGTDLRVWLWQTWQYDIKGILVWRCNLWTTGKAYPGKPQNPYADPMAWVSGYGTKTGEKRPWGNGDGRFIYPPEAAADGQQEETILDGPVDSIRWEMLRDGLEDYEYMVMLEKLLESREDTLSRRKFRKYKRLLEVPRKITSDVTIFTKDPAPIEAHRQRLAEAIEKLQF
jgi:hypothetical protein